MTEILAMKDLFYRAYMGTSFSPEKRAEQGIADFSAELAQDLAELSGREGNYKEKYLSYLSGWLSAKSRCLSSMITGPSNFPYARNQKNMNREHGHWEEFRAWRARYFKRAFAERTKTPEEEIDDALSRLDKEMNAHEMMIEANAILRKKITDEEKKQLLKEELDFSDKAIDELLTPDYIGRVGFASFSLTNSNARIKNLNEKLIIMQQRIERRDAFTGISFNGGAITIESDRVIIKHNDKPPREVINNLKAHGFHWSSAYKSWCRKHTANAIAAAKEICGVSA